MVYLPHLFRYSLPVLLFTYSLVLLENCNGGQLTFTNYLLQARHFAYLISGFQKVWNALWFALNNMKSHGEKFHLLLILIQPNYVKERFLMWFWYVLNTTLAFPNIYNREGTSGSESLASTSIQLAFYNIVFFFHCIYF